jgi:hypothetical protein
MTIPELSPLSQPPTFGAPNFSGRADTFLSELVVLRNEMMNVIAAINAYVPPMPPGALLQSNNLNDVAHKEAARDNLGLRIGHNVQAHAANLDGWAGVSVAAINAAIAAAQAAGVNAASTRLTEADGDQRYLRPVFESALLPFSGSVVTVAHGLSVMPTLVTAVFVCVNAAGGYSAGDEIHAVQFEKNYSNSAGFSVWADSTDVGFSWRNGPFLTTTKTGGSTYDPSSSDWNLKLRAFA